MSNINSLSSVDEVTGADLFVIWQTSNSDSRKASANLLLEFMQANLEFSADDAFTTQYSAPSATGFTVAVTDGSANIWLVLTPGATYATGTITLPAVGNAIDKQEVLINCTQIVTTLTIDGNGATAVTGEPAALAANDFFKLRYDLLTKTWYRIG